MSYEDATRKIYVISEELNLKAIRNKYDRATKQDIIDKTEELAQELNKLIEMLSK